MEIVNLGTDANLPSFEARAYQEMKPNWKLVEDVYLGTAHMRNQGQVYLPEFPSEKKDSWEVRRKTAVLVPFYAKTAHSLVGMIFNKPPKLGDDVPEIVSGNKDQSIEGQAENIDLAGTHWEVFANEFAFNVVHKGHAIILVDMQVAPDPNATARADIGRRPYWVTYTADQVVNWRTINFNGRTMLDQITFIETTVEQDGEFGEIIVVRYRVFRLVKDVDENGNVTAVHGVQFQLHKLVKEGTKEIVTPDGQPGDVLSSKSQPFTEIPIAIAYSWKLGYLQSQPMLLDLAHLNIEHYQSRSDYKHSLHVGCHALLTIFGAKLPNETALGPEILLTLPSDAKAQYTEPAGNAYAANRTNLEDIKAEMGTIALELLTPQGPAVATATERTIDLMQDMSPLQRVSTSIHDALELALKFHARYLGIDSGGSVDMGSKPDELTLSVDEMRMFSDMEAKGQLTIETLFSVLQSADRLPDDFDAKKEAAKIQKKRDAQPTLDFSKNVKASDLQRARDLAKTGGTQPPKTQPVNGATA